MPSAPLPRWRGRLQEVVEHVSEVPRTQFLEDEDPDAPGQRANLVRDAVRPGIATAPVVVPTKDVDAMVEWYGSVFGAAGVQVTTDATLVNRASCAVILVVDGGTDLVPRRLEFPFRSIDDVLETYMRLQLAGIAATSGADVGHATEVRYADPEGNVVALQYPNRAWTAGASSAPRRDAWPVAPADLLAARIAGRSPSQIRRDIRQEHRRTLAVDVAERAS